jgi:hypothetical protein
MRVSMVPTPFKPRQAKRPARRVSHVSPVLAAVPASSAFLFGALARPGWGWAGEDMGPPRRFRRPPAVAFLAYKLELGRPQVEQLVGFWTIEDRACAGGGGRPRVAVGLRTQWRARHSTPPKPPPGRSARRNPKRPRDAVLLQQIHAIEPSSRPLAYLIRAGFCYLITRRRRRGSRSG